LDYRPDSNRSLEEYFTLFADSAGTLCSFGDALLPTGDASAPEVFTDVDSKGRSTASPVYCWCFLMDSLVNTAGVPAVPGMVFV
jgi:hypothetical protein